MEERLKEKNKIEIIEPHLDPVTAARRKYEYAREDRKSGVPGATREKEALAEINLLQARMDNENPTKIDLKIWKQQIKTLLDKLG